MNIINNCGNDLLILINDILDISKIEAGELALNLKKVNIEVLIDNLYESMKPLSDEKNLKFIKTFEIDNTDILTDESRLKQIIKNLLSNAFKFTENGKVEIKVKADSENIFISVIDEGIGISKDKLLNIFDRFKQADGSTTRKYGGTGLGLAISKELAHLLGGDIKVSSEVNMGSDFQVILPKKAIIKNISDDKVDISSGEETVKTDEIVFFNMEDSLKLETIEEVDINRLNNLLIINGDHSSLFSSLVAFKKDGVNIEHTNSIENAQKVLQNSIFDALIIDIENSKEQNIKELIKVAKKNNTLFVAVGDEKIEDIDVNISRNSIDISFVKRVQNLVKAKKKNLD